MIAALRAREFDPKAAEYFTEKDLSHWRPYLRNEFGDWSWVHPMLEGSGSALEDGSDLPDPLTFARSERTTQTLLRHLAKTGDRTILLALARNRTTPMDVLWQLAAHDDAGIAQAAQELIARIDVKGTVTRRKAMEDAAFESGVVADAIRPNDPAAIDALAGSAPARPSAPEESEPCIVAPPAFAQDLLSILADDGAASGTYGSLSFNWLSIVKDTDSRIPVTFGFWDGRPLSWQVVDVVGKNLCLVCDTGVEFVPFSESGEPTSWERSSVKAWLESTFLAEAFNDDERAIITEVTCLDIEEVKRCLDDEGIACRAAPRLIGRGDPETDASGRCEWWLRPLIETEELLSAPRFGLSAIYQEWIERGCTTDKPYVAVRPALWVEMQ